MATKASKGKGTAKKSRRMTEKEMAEARFGWSSADFKSGGITVTPPPKKGKK